jgi:hypothetical protein
MSRLVFYISFLSGNFFYQYMQDVPNYEQGFERAWFMLGGILFAEILHGFGVGEK